jgi:hypothetical protein
VSEDGIWGDCDCVWVTGQIGEEEATKTARGSGRFVGTGTKRGKPTGVVEQGEALETQAWFSGTPHLVRSSWMERKVVWE